MKDISLSEAKRTMTVIKRDGREEAFSKKKLKRVVDWATQNNEPFSEELIQDTIIKSKNKIKIEELYENLIATAASKISMMYTEWEWVAGRLLLLDLYSHAYGIKDKTYPDFKEVIKKGVSSKVYEKEIFSEFSDEEITELGAYIKQDRDYRFTYNALTSFDKKYCKNYSKTKKLELPQHTYMRVAMGVCYNLPDRVSIIKDLYDILSKHNATLATPIMMNSGTSNRNMSSCILNTIGNDTYDIVNKLMTAGLYTKAAGGLAFDVSHIQAKGGYTKHGVEVSGIVPYIKNIESVVNSFLQGSKRRGAAVITCAWWHLEIEDFVVLKDPNSGTDENRARHLQYSVSENDLFLERMAKGEDITLFDPIDTPKLLETYGDEFKSWYEHYEQKVGIRKTTVSAKDLWRKILKYRVQTGNLYKFFTDNVNRANMTNRYVGSSNLCQEIVEPSRPAERLSEDFVQVSDSEFYTTSFVNEEIALCNLASFNLKMFLELKEPEQDKVIETIVRVMDNTIDIATYPRASARKPNLDNRYLGLGESNLAYYLAKKGIKFSDKEAEKEMFRVQQRLSAKIILASSKLASEKGTPKNYHGTKWAEGVLPIDLANKSLMKEFEQELDQELWEEVRQAVRQNGVRNTLLMAIAPTASSATSIGATESIEPVQNFSYRVEGAISSTVVVPEFKKLNQFYETAYDIDQFKLIKMASIRQMFLDQSQSVNMYISEENWDYDYLTRLHLYGWKLGLKTAYYLNTKKMEIGETCENCSS